MAMTGTVNNGFSYFTALGVIRRSSSLANNIGNPESTTPTAEFVVPKSIPRIISLIAADSREVDQPSQRQRVFESR